MQITSPTQQEILLKNEYGGNRQVLDKSFVRSFFRKIHSTLQDGCPRIAKRAFDAISTLAKERKRKDQKSKGPILMR